MKRVVTFGAILATVVNVGMIANVPVHASDTGGNASQEMTINSTRGAEHKTPTAQTTDIKTGTDKIGYSAIFDKDGNEVPATEIPQTPGIQPRSATQPTTVKYLSKGQSYWSEDFSASGMRYSGYMFSLTGTKNVRITANKGAFTLYITDRPEAGAVVNTYYLTPSGSPYRFVTDQWFYFGVNNPISGQNYYLQAY